jgi:hypothetical protein
LGPGISMSPGAFSELPGIEGGRIYQPEERLLMRKASTCLALLGLVVLGLSSVAVARPVVTLKVRAVPIPGFPGTGNILGAGAAVQATYTISGTESTGGVPSQLRRTTFYLPAGTRLHTQGFVKCATATLENDGPEACPKKSVASPVGTVGVADPIGGELVRENATVQAFFSPAGLNFYVNGSAPISAQIVATGHFVTASKPFGPKLVVDVPLVEALPGAPAVSTTSIRIKVGAAVRKGHKVVYYGTLPKSCPKGGFPVKSELTFQSGETVTVTAKGPCPKK